MMKEQTRKYYRKFCGSIQEAIARGKSKRRTFVRLSFSIHQK
jgi:hypothetical protein